MPSPGGLPYRAYSRAASLRSADIQELVAELTAAFLCAELEIPGRLQHPEFIANWGAVLRADNKAIWTADARATESRPLLA